MINNKQKGVSLIITLFIMIIILSVVLSISTILYSELKVIRNIGNATVSFYAADSGIEKVLYYDRQVKPTTLRACPNGVSDCLPGEACSGGYCALARGLCSIFDSVHSSAEYCSNGASGETSIYCNGDYNGNPPDVLSGNDCDPASCTDCTINFYTVLGDGITYSVSAHAGSASNVNSNPYLDIKSGGIFNGTGRTIEISQTLK